MPALITAYLAAAATFLVLDLFWLMFAAKGFYRSQLGDLMRDQAAILPAAAFYFLFLAGIVFFAVKPALTAGDWRVAVGYGAAAGLFAYGTYDLTNWATLKGWPVTMSLVDMAWGTVLSATTALVSYWVVRIVGSD